MIALICLMILVLILGSLSRISFLRRRQAMAAERQTQADWLAESGLERAWGKLNAADSYAGEAWRVSAEEIGGRDDAVVKISVAAVEGHPERREVHVEADYPSDESRRVRRTKHALFQLKAKTEGEKS